MSDHRDHPHSSEADADGLCAYCLLDTVKSLRSILAEAKKGSKLRQDVVEAAEKWAETQSVTDAVCPEVHNLWVAVGKLRSRVCESRGKHVGSQSCCPPRRASEGEPK